MPQHFLYFFPLPHGHRSFLPTLSLPGCRFLGSASVSMACGNRFGHLFTLAEPHARGPSVHAGEALRNPAGCFSDHFLKHLEALDLVFDYRITLTISTHADCVELVHGVNVDPSIFRPRPSSRTIRSDLAHQLEAMLSFLVFVCLQCRLADHLFLEVFLGIGSISSWVLSALPSDENAFGIELDAFPVPEVRMLSSSRW
ncbi:MAG: hypothetical protein QM757_01050 [Paludibaculum sp.]